MKLKELRNIQKKIAKRVVLRDQLKDIILVAGFDVSYKGKRGICACVILDKNFGSIEKKIVKDKISFPYIPTFLAFREGPLIIRTYRELKNKPDIILIDGNGILHPLGAGIASHVGVVLNKPTIGIAKKLLLGKCKMPEEVGKAEKIKLGNKVLGFALLTKKNCNPIYISPGHKISLETSIKIVRSLTKDKIPEPLRMAHCYAIERQNI